MWPSGDGGLVVCSPLALEARAAAGLGGAGTVVRTGYGAGASPTQAARLAGRSVRACWPWAGVGAGLAADLEAR